MRISMEDLKNLVKKLLDRKPVEAVAKSYFGPNVTYNDGNKIYKIDLCQYEDGHKHSLNLFIGETVLDISGHDYSCDITEKEYMELKWKMEGWEEELHADAFNEFADFVKQQEDPRNTLLND